MPLSLQQLYNNVGTFTVVRLAVVSVGLLGVGAFVWVEGGQPAPLFAFLAGVPLPVVAREALIERFEVSLRFGRIYGVALVASSVVIGVMRDWLVALIASPAFLAVYFFLAALYVGFYVAVFADVRVEVSR